MSALGRGERLGDLANVMDAIGVGVLVWDVDCTLLHANAHAVELAGRPLAAGLTCAALVLEARLCNGDDGTPYPVERLLPASVFEGVGARLEVAAFARPDGRECRVEGSTAVVRAGDGTTRYAVTTFFDVTERRRSEALSTGEASVLALVAEEAPLVDALAMLARVFEAHAEGMLASVLLVEGGQVRHAAAASLPEEWAKLVDGQPIGPNRGSCGTAAYLKQVVVVSDIATDPRWEPYREAALGFGLRACWSTPILDHDRQVVGTFAFYYTSPREPTDALLALAHRASQLASVAIQRHRHRAERQRMESELRELREREHLHAVLDVAPSAVAITRDGKVCYANAKFVELFGFGVGGDARARLVDAPVRERIRADVAAGHARYDLELRAEAKDGTVLDLLAAYRPIEYEHEPSLLIYLVDVSQLKEAQRVADAATRAKSLFLANMSHEIRTPLNAILGYAQLLHRERSLSVAQRRSIEVIHSSGRHLLTLVNDIIEMATLEEGRTTVAEEPFDLRDLLRELARMFAEPAGQKGLELVCELDSNLVRAIDGDVVKIRQILTNLLSNAVKFTEQGRIVLRASSSPNAESRHAITIAIEDTGCGIAESNLEGIFEAFEQPAPSTGTKGPGLGLALSLSFARLLGGRLGVESTPGRGSTFTLSFEAQAARVEGPRSAPSLVLSGDDADALVPSSLAGPGIPPLRAPSPPEHQVGSPRLAELVSRLPAPLVEELREAATEARAGRITHLAEQARPYSEVAAREIAELAQGFHYDALLSALGGGEG